MKNRLKCLIYSKRLGVLALGLPLLLLTSPATSAQQIDHPHQLGDFQGTWVRSINQRIFLVLRLQMHGDKLEGILSRPKHFSDVSGDGTTVTDPAAITIPVLDANVIGSELHFKTPDPNGAGKPDGNTMILWDPEHASLAYHNWDDMPRWILEKKQSDRTPLISANWPSEKEQKFSPAIVAIQEQLHAMVQRDQEADRPPYTHFKQLCADNFPIIEGLFRTYGWLKKSVFGKQTESDFWLLSSHQADAHPRFAHEELAAMQAAVTEDEATAATYALFYDSVAKAEGRPQHWGTKTVCEGGKRQLYAVDDTQGLERRRDEALLPPEAFYISSLPPCSK